MSEIKISSHAIDVLTSDPLYSNSLDISFTAIDVLTSDPIYSNSLDISFTAIDVLHKYVDNIGIEESMYNFSGSVTTEGIGTLCTLYAYNSVTKKLVGKTSSENIGYFLLPSTISGSCFIVCFSNNVSYNNLIAKQVIPYT